MAEITEAEARRICERLGIFPDHIMPNVRRPGPDWATHRYNDAPAWEIAQRAAAEGGSRDDA